MAVHIPNILLAPSDVLHADAYRHQAQAAQDRVAPTTHQAARCVVGATSAYPRATQAEEHPPPHVQQATG